MPPIAAPLRRRWREFRIRALPVIVFALLAVVVAALWQEVVFLRRGAIDLPDLDVESIESGSPDETVCADSKTGCLHPEHTNSLTDPYSTKD